MSLQRLERSLRVRAKLLNKASIRTSKIQTLYYQALKTTRGRHSRVAAVRQHSPCVSENHVAVKGTLYAAWSSWVTRFLYIVSYLLQPTRYRTTSVFAFWMKPAWKTAHQTTKRGLHRDEDMETGKTGDGELSFPDIYISPNRKSMSSVDVAGSADRSSTVSILDESQRGRQRIRPRSVAFVGADAYAEAPQAARLLR